MNMRPLLLSLLAALSCLAALAANPVKAAKPIVSILGDSYSTFEGFIPEGNATWYFQRDEPSRTDVNSVSQTWWWQLINDGGYILGVNNSYSGATVSFTGYRGEDYADRSFITRLRTIVPSDILLIFGATNDDWAGVPLGEHVYENLTRGHYYEFRPAVGRLVYDAQTRFPGTRIIFIINTDLRPEITSSIEEVCRHYGVETVRLHDIDKQNGHPSRRGMLQIKEQVMEVLAR